MAIAELWDIASNWVNIVCKKKNICGGCGQEGCTEKYMFLGCLANVFTQETFLKSLS